MTLPLLAQDRELMRGPRYAGALASIHPDVEFPEYWEMNMEFSPNTRPPFRWAGHEEGEH
jgi:hypothetical protein